MPEWTPAQQNAIDARKKNILVSAAAGSGKTAVLVERVVKLITDEVNPVDIDRLLIVTFTNAAAAEMKIRISKALSELIAEKPNNTNILRQLSLLPNAKVCTIDSFCINLVRENFFKLGISQDFSVLDNSQELLIQQAAIEEIIEEHYEQNDEFKALVELLSTTNSDNGLINAIKRINTYLNAQPFPFDWLDEVKEIYNPEIPFSKSNIYAYLMNDISESISFAKSVIKNSFSVLYKEDEMYEKYCDMLALDSSVFEALENEKSWNELKEKAEEISFSRAPSIRGYTSDVKEIIDGNRKLYKDVLSKSILPLLCATEEEIQADNEYLYPAVCVLVDIVKEYNERLLEIKKETDSFSFSDIEHFAIDLLFFKNDKGEIIRTELAKEYESNFAEILVDEYQDTNNAQDTLFKMLSNGRNLFMVGDVKQSIYRFRLAMPQIFNNKKDTFVPYDENDKSESRKIIFDMNFRSRKEICSFTNFIFSNLMSKKIGELEYTEEEYLNAGAEYPETNTPSVQLNVVQTPEGESAAEFEARNIAAMIVKKIAAKEIIQDKNGSHQIRYGDIAVLFRSSKNKLPVFSKVFAEFGIPVIANNKINLFENNEISILVSLLRVIDNPAQDIPLLTTLMSVFYGYTADDIALARANHKSNSLFSAISASDTFSAFISDLDKYRKYAASMSVESFIRQIISDTSYLSLISAMGNCEQRKMNVLKFVDLAASFDKGESVGLTAFMRYVDNIIEEKLEVESADVNGIGADCVTFKTIHGSKGLEYPVVILAGTSSTYNTDDLKNLVLLNDTYGIGLKVNNEEGLYRYNSAQYLAIKNMNSYAHMSENLRVLYVAVTRAKEQFIAFASFKNPEKHVDDLSKKIIDGKIYPEVTKSISNDADLLLLCALIHIDGIKLRAHCSKALPISDSDFKWDINILNEHYSVDEITVEKPEANDELVEKIREKLSFVSKRSELSSYLSKRAASSLDEKTQSFKFFAASKPAFLTEGKMTGAEKGTAMHAFMQHCDYSSAKEDLEGEIIRLQNDFLISERQAESLNRDKLKAFFESDLASRMFTSDKLYREFAVSSFIPVCELEDTDFEDKVFVQGVSDCVFEENGELVIVDYKTDKVSSSEELLELYKNQLKFYKNAVSKTLSKPVKEVMLYSFSLSKPCIYKYL